MFTAEIFLTLLYISAGSAGNLKDDVRHVWSSPERRKTSVIFNKLSHTKLGLRTGTFILVNEFRDTEDKPHN